MYGGREGEGVRGRGGVGTKKASLFELAMGGGGGGRGRGGVGTKKASLFELAMGGGGGGRGRGRGRTHSVGGQQHSCLWRGVHFLSQKGLLDLHTTHTHTMQR